MIAWMYPAMIALICFGLWGFFTKVAVMYIDPRSAFIYQVLGNAIMGIIALSLVQYKPEFNYKGLSFAALSGMATGLGCLFYFYALEKGKVSTIVTLTALYPLISIFLAIWLLREHLVFKQYIGILFGLIAIYFLS